MRRPVTGNGPVVRTADEPHGVSLVGDGLTRNRVRLSGGSSWQTNFRRRTTGRPVRTAMDVARLHRNLNHVLLDLQRAVERYAVAEATGPYSPAWSQVAEAPPSETRNQREELQAFKKVLNSASWLEEGRRRAATADVRQESPTRQRSTVRPGARPAEKRASGHVPRREARPVKGTGTNRPPSHMAGPGSRTPARRDEPPLLGTGQLSEIATELHPLLEQTARMGAITGWSRIGKRLPSLPRLHRDDQSRHPVAGGRGAPERRAPSLRSRHGRRPADAPPFSGHRGTARPAVLGHCRPATDDVELRDAEGSSVLAASTPRARLREPAARRAAGRVRRTTGRIEWESWGTMGHGSPRRLGSWADLTT